MSNHWERLAMELSSALSSGEDSQKRIAQEGLQLVSLLLRKNADYGNSAMFSPLLCPHMEASDAILCRMSDKIRRLEHLLSGNANRVSEAMEDTVIDLAGYCVLWLTERKGEPDASAPY